MRYVLLAAILLCPTLVQAQGVLIPQQVGRVSQRIEYPTPLRNFFFGKYLHTPIYQYRPYNIVTPPPQPMYYQPPSYLAPACPQPCPSQPSQFPMSTLQYRVQ